MKSHHHQFPVRLMCKVIGVHPSGFYAWLKKPLSTRAKEDQYLIAFIKQFWIESGTVYGYRKVYDDMQSAGEPCGKNRVYRLMRAEGIQSQRGYKRRGYYGGKPTHVADNILERDFSAAKPNQTWVTDITYIRTYGLVVSGRCLGLVLASDRWLVNAIADDNRDCYGCVNDGVVAKASQRGSGRSFRSRIAIHKR